MAKTAFDTATYIQTQVERIEERAAGFDGRLYLEFEGRMAPDRHAERVLPGFDPMAKLGVLEALRHRLAVLICVNARALQAESRLRASLGAGRTADLVVLQAVDGWKSWGLPHTAVIINRFDGQREAMNLRDRLEVLGARVYTQPEIGGYPADVDAIVGPGGWGRFPRIAIDRPLVLVTGLGIESGRHTTSLSLLARDLRDGVESGYARWTTFPVPQLPPGHPVNAAFDAASADVDDRSLVDPFHLEAAGDSATTSSREVGHFALVRRVLERIVREDGAMASYRTPTALNVNACAAAIVDDEEARRASRAEIVRRWYLYNEGLVSGDVDPRTMERMDRVLHEQGLRVEDREVVGPARRAAEEARSRGKGHKGAFVGAAIQLPDREIVTGSNSRLLHAASAVLLHAVKRLGGIDEGTDLLPEALIERIRTMKRSVMSEPSTSLSVEEMLVALSIASADSPAAQMALDAMSDLRGCEMHMTHRPTPSDASGLRKVGLYATSDASMTWGGGGYEPRRGAGHAPPPPATPSP